MKTTLKNTTTKFDVELDADTYGTLEITQAKGKDTTYCLKVSPTLSLPAISRKDDDGRVASFGYVVTRDCLQTTAHLKSGERAMVVTGSLWPENAEIPVFSPRFLVDAILDSLFAE